MAIRKKRIHNNSLIEIKTGKPYIISLIGVSRGAGTTHMSIMLGNVMANAFRKRTAIVELNTHKDYIKLMQETGIEYDSIATFSYKGIDFYRNLDRNKATELCHSHYEVVILDMDGKTSKNEEAVLFESDRQILVADMNLWKQKELLFYLKDNLRDKQTPRRDCVTLSYDQELAQSLEREYAVRFWPVPLERNPFLISGQNLLWFQELVFEL